MPQHSSSDDGAAPESTGIEPEAGADGAAIDDAAAGIEVAGTAVAGTAVADTAVAGDASAPAPRRRPWARAGDILLTVAAIAGALSIVATIIALVFKISIMMFSTGSMTPTIPAGSIALVHQIPAAEAEVGDIVTIDRQDELPVTHRITRIADSETEGNRVITMRGDANPTEDPEPYDVATVRRVFFSIPGLAPGIVALSNPILMGTITVLAAGLVTWAFWPKRGRHRPR